MEFACETDSAAKTAMKGFKSFMSKVAQHVPLKRLRNSTPAPPSPKQPLIPSLNDCMEDPNLLRKFGLHVISNWPGPELTWVLQLLVTTNRYALCYDTPSEPAFRQEFLEQYLYRSHPCGVPHDDVLGMIPMGASVDWDSVAPNSLSFAGRQRLAELQNAPPTDGDGRLLLEGIQSLKGLCVCTLSEEAWPHFVSTLGDAFELVRTHPDKARRAWPCEKYTAQNGDTVASIAQQCAMPVTDLCQLNALRESDSIHIGTRLSVQRGFHQAVATQVYEQVSEIIAESLLSTPAEHPAPNGFELVSDYQPIATANIQRCDSDLNQALVVVALAELQLEEATVAGARVVMLCFYDQFYPGVLIVVNDQVVFWPYTGETAAGQPPTHIPNELITSCFLLDDPSEGLGLTQNLSVDDFMMVSEPEKDTFCSVDITDAGVKFDMEGILHFSIATDPSNELGLLTHFMWAAKTQDAKDLVQMVLAVAPNAKPAPAEPLSSPSSRTLVPAMSSDSKILDPSQAAQLASKLPQRLQIRRAALLFSLDDGSNMGTFLRKVGSPGFGEMLVLVFEDSRGHKFGAFTTGTWKMNDLEGYAGTGESFVFSFWPDQFRFGLATQRNSYFQAMHSEGMTLGGGGDGAHLTICKEFRDGTTAQSVTFDTGPLCTPTFKVVRMEAWGFVSTRNNSSFVQGHMNYNFLFSDLTANDANIRPDV